MPQRGKKGVGERKGQETVIMKNIKKFGGENNHDLSHCPLQAAKCPGEGKQAAANSSSRSISTSRGKDRAKQIRQGQDLIETATIFHKAPRNHQRATVAGTKLGFEQGFNHSSW